MADNTKDIKAKIVDGHRRGVCNRAGETVFKTDCCGKRRAVAKPTLGFHSTSAVKTYVLRNGKMVLKE
jgi:hypothetical protein